MLAAAEVHEAAAREMRASAGNYLIASATERRTAQTLAPLAAVGYQLLHDRRWPGTRRAQVDLAGVPC